MSTAQASRRNFSTKAVNKENTEPGHGPKSFIRRDAQKAPFQQERIKAAQALANKALAEATKGAAKSAPEVVQRRIASRQVDRVGHVGGNAKPRPTQNPAPIGRQRQVVPDAPKLQQAAAKSALGMYKGKVIQSKIGSIWKQSNDGEEKHVGTERAGNLAKSRSKSVSDTRPHGTQKPAPQRSKSLVDRSKPGAKPTVTTRPLVAACPPARVAPPALSRNTSVPPKGKSGAQALKPKVAVTDRKVNKPPVVSTLSQYRTTESKEERRARLAEWLASKGKTLKRPAMTTTVSTASVRPKVPQRKPEPSVQTDKEGSVADVEDKKPEPVTHKQTPVIMNTTLDLLENSDVTEDVHDGVDNVVVNLCDALEAMEMPSRCQDEPPEMKESQDLKSQRIVEDEEMEKGMCCEDGDDVMKTTPHTEESSVVRYSVKTTPYLQSVKKTIEGEIPASGSRRKSNIKDLKLLTPVRRSARNQRNSSRLPAMLLDHDPCVSSLAELVQLDGECNAYVYRRNPAILCDLPDEQSA
ncbi:cytoskeleton-associated protein 2 [Synchiropus splendidus]|uniref:cytoskeleton-associated protein 2 n=1 Tax=Synchiropus splendidus TaxID=270530 RepID=UPI00237EAEA1|nr:cytoskeleton-associated protein 2 [Synchiropus splendidus]